MLKEIQTARLKFNFVTRFISAFSAVVRVLMLQ